MRRVPIVLCALALAGAAVPADGLRVTNLAAGETLRYPVALLIGEADAPDGATLTVTRRAEAGEPRTFATAVHGGRFKALAELAPGLNHLALSAGEKQADLDLHYEPQTNPYYVRCIYYTDASGTTEYQTEIEGDAQDYAGKLDASMKLLQTFTAETLNDQGYGRKTFNLELDEAGRVRVHVVRGEHPIEHYHARDGGQLYGEIHDHLARTMPDPYAKNVVLMAFTRWDAERKRALAHTALGGGDMGLFGTGDFFTWPSSVEAIQAALSDTTRVDAARSFDDSAGRSTYWGLAATTLGATIHETGHAFGLPHSPDPFCIMSRGFDHVNRMFTLIEPPCVFRPEAYAFPNHEIARFSVAGRLAWHRWFQLDRREYRDGPAAEVQVDPEAGTLVLTSEFGLRVVGINGDDHSREDDVFNGEPPRRLEYPLADLNRRGGGKGVYLALIDAEGNEMHVGADRLADPRQFLRAWRVSSEGIAWPARDRFVEVSSERVAELITELGARGLESSGSPFIDLFGRHPGASNDRVAYALGTVRADTQRQVTLLTGSDDALRVWLNGELVVERLVLRPPAPDQDSTSVTLREGENTLLVEVSNGGGGWGFYVRLETPDGVPLVPDGEGRVTAP